MRGESCGARRGDVVVDGDVAEELGVALVADGDGAAGLRDGRRGDDLLEGVFLVRREEAGVDVHVADDVELIVLTGRDVDGAGSGGDGDGGRAAEGEGLVEGAVGGEGGSCEEGEGCGEKSGAIHGVPPATSSFRRAQLHIGVLRTLRYGRKYGPGCRIVPWIVDFDAKRATGRTPGQAELGRGTRFSGGQGFLGSPLVEA